MWPPRASWQLERAPPQCGVGTAPAVCRPRGGWAAPGLALPSGPTALTGGLGAVCPGTLAAAGLRLWGNAPGTVRAERAEVPAPPSACSAMACLCHPGSGGEDERWAWGRRGAPLRKTAAGRHGYLTAKTRKQPRSTWQTGVRWPFLRPHLRIHLLFLPPVTHCGLHTTRCCACPISPPRPCQTQLPTGGSGAVMGTGAVPANALATLTLCCDRPCP